MEKLITDFLDNAAESCPDKIAFVESKREITYSELRRESLVIAEAIADMKLLRKPIAVLMDKSIACIECFLGIAYSGNFYTVIDTNMPAADERRCFHEQDPCCG